MDASADGIVPVTIDVCQCDGGGRIQGLLKASLDQLDAIRVGIKTKMTEIFSHHIDQVGYIAIVAVVPEADGFAVIISR